MSWLPSTNFHPLRLLIFSHAALLLLFEIKCVLFAVKSIGVQCFLPPTNSKYSILVGEMAKYIAAWRNKNPMPCQLHILNTFFHLLFLIQFIRWMKNTMELFHTVLISSVHVEIFMIFSSINLACKNLELVEFRLIIQRIIDRSSSPFQTFKRSLIFLKWRGGENRKLDFSAAF